MLTKLEIAQERELEWLRFFYREVSDALGPADADIYQMIKEAYVDHGGILSPGYELEETDYDENEELEDV